MIKAERVLTAWDKTLETRDFSHLSVFLSDDFQFEDTTGEVEDLATTKSWCILGEIRIKNFKIILDKTSRTGYIINTKAIKPNNKGASHGQLNLIHPPFRTSCNPCFQQSEA